jgi:integrase
MPRPRKPARLWQHRDGAWIILDAGRQHRTGACGDGGRAAAEAALARYIAGRAPERAGPAQPHEITVGEVLALYAREKGPTLAAPASLGYAVKALAPFWGPRTCDAVKGSTCRAYAAQRAAATGTARRELGVLQAALNHAYAEGRLIYAPKVTLAEVGSPRDRWLTRNEAAMLLRAAAPHVRRFIVLALASGRRASAILALRLAPSLDSGWIDAAAGIVHFEGARQRRTKKRRGSIQAPRVLAAHTRRWRGSHAILWRGQPVAEIDTGIRAAARRAGLDGVTPHVLKHTAVTWAFQRGMTLEDAVDWFATSPPTLMKHYRAHSPHYQSRARAIMEQR